jgi:hypothetical protein
MAGGLRPAGHVASQSKAELLEYERITKAPVLPSTLKAASDVGVTSCSVVSVTGVLPDFSLPKALCSIVSVV